MTDFWEPFAQHGPQTALETEYNQGCNAARAAAKVPGLEHYIWSTLPNAERVSGGHFVIPHFASKYRVDDYIRRELPGLLRRTTLLWVALFAGNVLYPAGRPAKWVSCELAEQSAQPTPTLPTFRLSWFPVLRRGEEKLTDARRVQGPADKYALIQPVGSQTQLVQAGDQRKNVGMFVDAIVEQPGLTQDGRVVFAESGEVHTQAEQLAIWGRVTGTSPVYLQVSLDEYDKLFPMWGAEWGIMMQYFEWAGGKKSWSCEQGVLTKEDLGVIGLVGFEEGLRALDLET